MPGRVFTFVAALSLLLCIATTVLWVRSYWGCDDIGVEWSGKNNGRSAELYTVRGRIGMGFAHGIDLRPDMGGSPFAPAGWNFFAQRDDHPPFYPHGRQDWGPFAFVYDGGDDRPGQRFQDIIRIVQVPAWSVATLWALPSAAWIGRWGRARRRGRRGFCRACVYNLTGNVTGICPECGTRVRE
jgi:hypothetical protein